MMTPEQIAAMREVRDNKLDELAAHLEALHEFIIAQAAEIERLQSGIPWRDGPPPAEWRDGRQVLVWTKSLWPVFWEGAWFITHENGYSVDESMITHHAAINKPGEAG